MSMKVYLVSRYARFPELQTYAKDLKTLGHTITSRWIRGDHELRAHGEAERADWQQRWALEDWSDLEAADTVIAFTESIYAGAGHGRGGRHVEWGMALTLCKRCIAVGARENVFYWLPQVEFFATWSDCLTALHKEDMSRHPFST